MHTRAAFGELLQDRKGLGMAKFLTRARRGYTEGYLCYFEILRLSNSHTHIFEIVLRLWQFAEPPKLLIISFFFGLGTPYASSGN